ncbi:TRAP transporter small permease [uncultured Desulfuromusa sp.]|uniref:TRAP transporter small permease n=1 Tax=uncultured Desulfuromusa sp. TaxID=219183 RepID=UPI00374785E3
MGFRGDLMGSNKDNFLRRGLDRLYVTSGWFAAACIAVICILVLCQVSLNAVDRLSGLLTGSAIGLTIPSYADFTGFFLAAASFLALAYTLREGGHIRVTLVLTRLNERLRHGFEIWCLLFCSAVAVYFSWYTFLLIKESYVYKDLSSGMIAVPIWIPQSTMLIGLIVLSIALIDELCSAVLGHKPGYAESGENLLDQTDNEPAS